MVYFGAEVWRETSREDGRCFSDPPFLDFRAAVCSTRAGERSSDTARKGRTLGESQTFHLHDDQLHPPQLPGHVQTPRLKLRDADVSFSRNLLRIGENMKQQL